MTLFTAKYIISLNIPFHFLYSILIRDELQREDLGKDFYQTKKTFECFSEISTQDPILSSNEKCKLEVVHGFRRLFSTVY